MANLYKELRRTRVMNMILSLLMVLMLAGGGIFYSELKQIQTQADPVIQQIEALNVEELNLTLEETNSMLQSVDWEQVSQVLGQLDVDALNTAIENLDTKELTETLTNINNAVDTLEQIRDYFKQMGNSLSQLLPFAR